MSSYSVVLGIGSNLGDKRSNIFEAIRLLESIWASRVTISPFYASKALLDANAPKNWELDFLNLAVSGKSTYSPLELLSKIRSIEKKMQRTQHEMRWGPREIDIDILVYGDQIIRTPELTIPHKELLNRPFALWPLADIAPDWLYPIHDQHYLKSAQDLSQLFGCAYPECTLDDSKTPLFTKRLPD